MSANAVRGVAAALARAEATDADLLRRFAAGRDEAAFAELVRRHGPLVLGVCRRVVPDYHLAEDAFQAVFVVLARKATDVDPARPLGPWLYGVAHRVALRARARIGRRTKRESLLAREPPMPTTPPAADDVPAVLDQEIGRLSAAYRDAVVLCELQGLGRKEAARKLGIREGTLSSRLAAARKILAGRLARRGVAPSAALAAVVTVPPALADAAVRSASGSASGVVRELSREVLRAMLHSKLKLGLVLAAALVALAVPFTAPQRPAASAAPASKAEPRAGVIVVTRAADKDRMAEILDPTGKPVGTVNLGDQRGAYTPRLSPDGKRVAVLTYIDFEVGTATRWPSFALYVVDLGAKTAPEKPLVTRVRCPGLAWSADGKKLYVSNIPKEKLRVADNVDQVVPVRTRVYDLAAGTDSPTDIPEGHIVCDVAPDGKSVLTTVQVWDPEAERLTNHLVPLDTFKPVQLGKDGLAGARLSPGGARVIGVRGRLGNSAEQGLFVFDIARREETRVALPKELDGALIQSACWAPDGKHVLFQWNTGGGVPGRGAGGPAGAPAGGGAGAGHVSVVDIDGSNEKRIASDNGAGEVFTGIDWK